MTKIKSLAGIVLLSVVFLFTGCGNDYAKGDLIVDRAKGLVLEKESKDLANGTFTKNDNKETVSVVLEDGLIVSSESIKGDREITLEFDNKVLTSLVNGKTANYKFFEDGTIKEIFNSDNKTVAIIKFEEGESLPYFMDLEVKPSNNKIVFEDDTMTTSVLDSNEVVEELKGSESKAKLILQQMSRTLKHVGKMSQQRMYKEALSEII